MLVRSEAAGPGGPGVPMAAGLNCSSVVSYRHADVAATWEVFTVPAVGSGLWP